MVDCDSWMGSYHIIHSKSIRIDGSFYIIVWRCDILRAHANMLPSLHEIMLP